MAEHPHLILPRAEVTLERRKKPGFGSRTTREHREHSEQIRVAVEGVLAHREQIASEGINPALIVKVRTDGIIPEEDWERAGLAVLGTGDNHTVILFASD